MPVRDTNALELIIEPANDSYDPDDERWRDQVNGLLAELHDHVEIHSRGHAAAGSKGAAAEIVIALGTAGAFTGTVECFRSWLGRDRHRRIDIRWSEDGVEQHVSLSGDGIDSAGVQEIARAAAHRVGGAGWPVGTGPS